MKKSMSFAAAVMLLTLITSCASIVSHSVWPLSVDSNPSGSTISVTNKKGMEVYKGSTPATMKLKSSAGFFSMESYKIHFQLSGYDTRDIPVECRVNGWYWGNILLGGVVGMLIIDPATGAMYKLDTQNVYTDLSKASADTKGAPNLKIYAINDLPQSLKGHLVKIK